MTQYRTQKRSTADVETVALRELLHRVKRLRRRVFLPTAIAAFVAGNAGLAAHVLGYWSLLGFVTHDGAYFVSSFTIVGALLLPALPFAAVGLLSYRLLGARLRRSWCDEFADKHGLDRASLERNAARYG